MPALETRVSGVEGLEGWGVYVERVKTFGNVG